MQHRLPLAVTRPEAVTITLLTSLLIAACPSVPVDTDTSATASSGGEGTTMNGSATSAAETSTSTTASTTTPTGTTSTETTGPTSSATDSTGGPPTCTDGAKDGDETDVDCGGSCPGCPNGGVCVAPTDCESGTCVDGLCVAPSCTSDDECGGGDECSEPACDLETMTCALTSLPDQTPCDDGLLCTPMPGSCQGGECVTGSIAPISLAALPAGAGFIIDGEVAGSQTGFSVQGVGDVNGDGLDDLAIGVGNTSAFPLEERGRNYIVFGKADDATIDLADVHAGVGGFSVRPATGELLGHYIKGVGDVNQDGLADLVVAHPGAYNLTKTVLGSGRVYVVLGKEDTAAVLLDDIQAGSGGFAIVGESGGGLGYALGTAGDVDGDGRDDILIGEPFFPKQSLEGRVLVVFGGDAQPLRTESTIAAGQGGFAIVGAAPEHHLGSGVDSLGAAGDVDGDGHADLLIGNSAYSGPENNAGRLYFVRGKTGGAPIDLADVAAGSGGYVVGGTAPHSLLGENVADLGDINDDGIRDFLVSASHWWVNGVEPGRVYVVYGKLDGAAVDVADLEAGIGGYAVTSEVVFDGFGFAAKALGDLDGDERIDFGIGAIATNYTKTNAGRVSIVLSPSMPAPIPAAALADGGGGFVIDGANVGDGAYHVTGVGDVNGDGIPDIAIGAHGVDDKLKDAGRVYVLFGPLCAVP